VKLCEHTEIFGISFFYANKEYKGDRFHMRSKYKIPDFKRRSDFDMTYDVLFKFIFFRDSAASNVLRKELFDAILADEIDIKKIELMNVHCLNADTSMVQRIVDSVCNVNDHDMVIMEMQRQYVQGDEDRFTGYLCGVIDYRFRNTNDCNSGKNIEVIFMRSPFPNRIKNAKNRYIELRNEEGETFSDLMRIKIVILYDLVSLFQKDVKQLSKKERYCLWLRYGHVQKYKEKMQAIIANEEGLQMAEKEIRQTRENPALLGEIMMRYREQADRKQRELLKKLLEEEKAKYKNAEQQRKHEKQQHKHEKQQRIQAEQHNKIMIQENRRLQYILKLMKEGMSYEQAETESHRFLSETV